jgi:transposase-like protein
MGAKMDEAVKAEAIKMLRAGKTLGEVSKALGIGKSTAYRLRAEDQGADATEADMAEDEGSKVEELEQNVAYYEGRERELLEAIADLSMENMRMRRLIAAQDEG